MARKKNSDVVSALLYIIVGALLIIFKARTLDIAMTVAGVVFIVSGIIELIRKNPVSGVISIIIGAVILVLGWTITEIVLLVLGILIAVKGIISLVQALKKRRKKLLQVIFPIITIAVGLVIAFGNGLDIAILIGGIILVIDGVLGLVAAIK